MISILKPAPITLAAFYMFVEPTADCTVGRGEHAPTPTSHQQSTEELASKQKSREIKHVCSFRPLKANHCSETGR